MPRRQPENTIPSFEAALALGADGIELDVHATSDGMVVVHHDPALQDGTEISLSPWSRVRQSQVAPGVTMPSLDEVCRLVEGRAELFVEIKGAGIEDAVVRVLEAHDCVASIHSFDHALIGRLGRRRLPYRLGLLYEEAPVDVRAEMERRGALDLWPERGLVDHRMVDEVHAMGGRVIPWTVNDPTKAAMLTALGVDGLCTDDVSMLG
jgi:glycerophosphoryl diester phosphodiesterase